MSDRVVVMDKGKIQQIGTPEDIYNEPVNAFVADFIGESNIVDAVMIKDYYVRISGVVFDCLDKGFEPNEKVEAVIRPEDIKSTSSAQKTHFPARLRMLCLRAHSLKPSLTWAASFGLCKQRNIIRWAKPSVCISTPIRFML